MKNTLATLSRSFSRRERSNVRNSSLLQSSGTKKGNSPVEELKKSLKKLKMDHVDL